MIFKRKWVIPLAIAVVLLAAWAFRWNEVASKTSDSVVIKWVEDRWTGTVWADRYAATKSTSTVTSGLAKDTYDATTIWEWALLIDGVWLGLAFWKDRKEATSG